MKLFSELEAQYDLPSGLLNAVMQQESGGNVRAVSPKGARGAFQFMPATAKQYGVDVNDLNSSATGAAKMYADLLKQNNGDLSKALAGYNWGQGNVQRKGMERMPAETRQYIQKVTANMQPQVNYFDKYDAVEAEPNYFDKYDAPQNAPQSPDSSTVKDILGGAVRGAGSVGATLLTPVDWLARKAGVQNEWIGRTDRREAMDEGLRNMGANPDSLAFKLPKLAAEIAGTAGVGGTMAKLPVIAKGAPQLANALRTGGFRLGGPAATGIKEMARNIATRAGAGAAVGGASAGLIDPQTAGYGAAIGAALPPIVGMAGGVGRAIKATAIDPFVNQKAIIGNTLARTVGTGNIGDISANIAPKTAGVNYSLGQRSGSQSINAVEDTIKAINPGGELSRQAANNRQVLADSIRGLAQDEGAIMAATQARKSATAPLYQAASKSEALADPARVVKLIDRIVAKSPANAALVSPMEQIRGSLFGASMRQKPHELMSAVDNIKALLGKQENAFVRGELNTIKKALEHQISKAAPEFKQAERTFAEMSRPVNQMKIGQALASKLIPSTAGDIPSSLNAASLATALRNPNQIARAATGFKRAKLDKTLTPEQLAMVTGVSDDASRMAEMARLGAGFGSPTARRQSLGNFVGENLKNEAPGVSMLTGLLGKAPVIGLPLKAAGVAADAIGGKINQNMLIQLEDMLANNPDEAIKLMQSAAARQAVKEGLTKENINAPLLRALLFATPANQANP